MPTLSDPEIKTNVDEFAALARRYCVWAEGPPGDPDEDLTTARGLLALLQAAVLPLPDNCPTTGSADDLISTEAWKERYARFELLPIKGYWKVFDALVMEQPVFNTLADDLSDIWRDLKQGLLLYDSGNVEEAIWQWRFNYEIHWGRHLLGAEYAIHSFFS